LTVRIRYQKKDEYDWVLVWADTPDGRIMKPFIAELREGIWYADTFDQPLETILSIPVTHWMPIPFDSSIVNGRRGARVDIKPIDDIKNTMDGLNTGKPFVDESYHFDDSQYVLSDY
jgi:hypothetical protein